MNRVWTLRRRLVLGVVALLAVASIAIGAVSVAFLRSSLIDRLDSQLTDATERSERSDRFDGDARGPDSRFSRIEIPPEFLSVGIISGVAVGGELVATAYFTDDGSRQSLTATQAAQLVAVPTDGDPHTVTLDGLGSYRVAAGDTDRGATQIIALPLAPVDSLVTQLLLVIGGVTAAGVVIAAFGATALIRRSLRPLDRVAATAARVAELPLDRGEVALGVRVPEEDADGRTEVGQVGASINRMLGHIASALAARQESERKVRQFVADASHELRTPLASIRGYSELTRRSGHDLPPDVVHAIGRVESEAVRMTSLVEDLLLLARLDEGRDLERSEVDVSRLLIDAVSDAHAAGPDHDWSLDLPDDPVIIPGDALRLHQVIANLLTNARVHTPAGTSITVALAAASDAVITVTDAGPGIQADVRDSLFERFARGDGSRSRAAGSTGLGLAIVRAVVAGHNGTVGVESEPGRTVFTVTLPADGAASPSSGTAVNEA